MKPILPTPTHAVRLQHDGEPFFDRLGDLDSTQILARNTGAALSKQVTRMQSITAIDDEEGSVTALAPELGLVFSGTVLKATHGAIRDRAGLCPVVELDFDGQPNGLSFAARPGTPSAERLTDLMGDHATQPVAVEELESWRTQLQSPLRMCRCCAKAAMARMQKPKTHPMYGILSHASTIRQPLYCRLKSAHVDLTTWVIATKVDAAGGWIQCSDASNALQINAGMCQKLHLTRESLDGEWFTMARLYDSRGAELFQFWAPNPKLLPLWQRAAVESGDWVAEEK